MSPSPPGPPPPPPPRRGPPPPPPAPPRRARPPGGTARARGAPAGAPGPPPLLMVSGIGRQMIGWQPEFLTALADRGLRVIRFDNRDVGLSTHLDGTPDLAA